MHKADGASQGVTGGGQTTSYLTETHTFDRTGDWVTDSYSMHEVDGTLETIIAKSTSTITDAEMDGATHGDRTTVTTTVTGSSDHTIDETRELLLRRLRVDRERPQVLDDDGEGIGYGDRCLRVRRLGVQDGGLDDDFGPDRDDIRQQAWQPGHRGLFAARNLVDDELRPWRRTRTAPTTGGGTGRPTGTWLRRPWG